MNIMIFDVPASSGGALTILNEYYNSALQDRDKSKQWIFVVSNPDLQDSENVKVLKFPWIKKSWFHRLYFDNFIAPKLVREYKADEVLSLQNLIVPKVNVPQKLYIHQPLPFVDKKYKITENFKFWVYQNIIGKKILDSAQKADEVIVQTEWFKKEVALRANISEKKIKVIPPKLNIDVKKYFTRSPETLRTFFYPASGISYKNHKVIVEALLLLKTRDEGDFKVIFTLTGSENKQISKLYKIVKKYNLPIDFIGSVSYEEVLNYYSISILLFPSYIETFGLPMLEASMHKTLILASDCPFSKEILSNYDDARLLDPHDPKLWAMYISMIASSVSQKEYYAT